MLYKYFNNKKGFSMVEILIVVAILSILVGIATPIITSGLKRQKEDDCRNQRLVIETAVKQAMFGMIDNGAKQDKITFKCTTLVPGDLDGYSVVQNETLLGQIITIDGEEHRCFKLTEDDSCFTFAQLRGGYRPGTVAGFSGEGLDKYKEGCDNGYYLKKIKFQMDNGGLGTPFYKFLDSQKLPVCPFADETNSQGYYYYVLEDGTVRCGCEFVENK